MAVANVSSAFPHTYTVNRDSRNFTNRLTPITTGPSVSEVNDIHFYHPSDVLEAVISNDASGLRIKIVPDGDDVIFEWEGTVGAVRPFTGQAANFGASSTRWGTGYFSNLNVAGIGTLTISMSGRVDIISTANDVLLSSKDDLLLFAEDDLLIDVDGDVTIEAGTGTGSITIGTNSTNLTLATGAVLELEADTGVSFLNTTTNPCSPDVFPVYPIPDVGSVYHLGTSTEYWDEIHVATGGVIEHSPRHFTRPTRDLIMDMTYDEQGDIQVPEEFQGVPGKSAVTGEISGTPGTRIGSLAYATAMELQATITELNVLTAQLNRALARITVLESGRGG
jgi:hypothetical protein